MLGAGCLLGVADNNWCAVLLIIIECWVLLAGWVLGVGCLLGVAR